MPLISAQQLADFATSLLRAADVNRDEARRVAESLVDANLCGHDSHGVVRLPWYIRQLEEEELVAGAPLEVLRETEAVVVCDAHYGFGQVQAARLTERTIAKARRVGVACGTACKCGHVGRLGEFTETAAQQDLAAMLTVNDNGVLRIVAPPGGTKACISTNPLSIAVPTDDGPIVFDAATSAVAQGKIIVHRLDDRPCPEGWLQDAQGRPTSDPHALHADPPGALLPLGGSLAYKGFGLAVMLDMLAGGLSGGFCPPPEPGARMCNTVMMVIWDPELFAGREHLRFQATKLIDSIRGCPRRDGVERIQLPGDSSRETRETRSRDGIPLQEGTWQALLEVAAQLEVAVPS